jgi:hypothetical protein
MKFIDTIYVIFSMSPKECLNITPKELEEGKKESSNKARIDIIRKIDEE